jgi:tRNA wybutosine-synthesizing protein 3
MYIFGGHITQPASEYFDTVKQDMYEYKFATREWKELGNEGAPRRTEHSAVVCGDTMVIFGGYSGSGYENSVYVCSLSTAHWQQLETKGDIPSPRSAHTAALVGSKMYVFGGWNGVNCMNDLYELDLETKTWTALKSEGELPCSRCSHGATIAYPSSSGPNRYTSSAVMYVFGGYATDKSGTSNKGYLNDLYELHLDTLTWKSAKQSGLPPSPRSRFRMASHNNAIYLFGGWNSQTHFSSLYKYSMDTGIWSAIETNFDSEGIGQFSLVVHKDFMYIFSGFSPKVGSRTNLFVYQLRHLQAK